MRNQVVPNRLSQTGNGMGGVSPFTGFPQLANRYFSDFDRAMERFFNNPWQLQQDKFDANWRWGVEVEDKENMVVVQAEAPGFEAGDFDIQVHDGNLSIKACRKQETKKDQETSKTECTYSYSAGLPAGIEQDKIEASYKNGILTIQLPKSPAAKALKIAVKKS
jgi:HSP20 family protein